MTEAFLGVKHNENSLLYILLQVFIRLVPPNNLPRLLLKREKKTNLGYIWLSRGLICSLVLGFWPSKARRVQARPRLHLAEPGTDLMPSFGLNKIRLNSCTKQRQNLKERHRFFLKKVKL